MRTESHCFRPGRLGVLLAVLVLPFLVAAPSRAQVCSSLNLDAPATAGGCPDVGVSLSFTIVNEGPSTADVYIRTPTTGGWIISPNVINNLAVNTPVQVVATRSTTPSPSQVLTLRAWSYPSSTTPADTAGNACDFVTDTVNIVAGQTPCITVSDPTAIQACAGDSVDVAFTVTNCGSVAANVNMMAACDGQVVNTVSPFNFDLSPGQSIVSTVTCVVPDDAEPGDFLTVVNSAWASTSTGCAFDVAGDTRINVGQCPVSPSCGPLSLVGPPADTSCPGSPISVTFTIENQGEPAVDVYLLTSSTGWTLSPTLFNNVASGGTRTVVATRTNPSNTNQQLVVRATSYLATSTPADTAGESCDFVTETVNILAGQAPCVTVNNPTAIQGCPGDTVDVAFTVTNCGNVAANVNMAGACDGQIVDTVEPFNFNLNPGQSVISTVTCVVPDDAEAGQFLTVVNSAWARTAAGCAFDIAGNTRINVGQCPVSPSCGPLSLVGPPADTTCPGEPLSVTFTVENQGEPTVDVYLRTSSTGWTLSPTLFNNVASGGTRTVVATRTNPSSTTQQLVVRATSYLNTTTPADTAGESCDFVRETVTIVPGSEPCGPVGGACGPLALVAPPADTACPGQPVQFTFTVENQGQPNVDVYLRTASGWTLSPTVINNLASGSIRQVTVTRSTAPASPLQLTLRASAYPATTSPPDTAGDACDFVREVVSIATGPCEELAQVCPRTIGFWRQQTQQKPNGSRKICSDDPADRTDMQRLWENVIGMTDLTAFRRNDGSTVSVSSLRNLGDDDLFDALGCELEGPRPMTQRNMAEIQYLALLLNVSMGLVDLDTPVTTGGSGRTVGDAIDDIEQILNRSNATNSQLGNAVNMAECINSGSCIRGGTCEGGENGPFAGLTSSCPRNNVGFVCPNGDDDDDDDKSDRRSGSVPTGPLALSAYPNPFNPTAVLRWSVGSDKVGLHAVIDVFDAAGRPVAHLFDGTVTSESNELLLSPDNWASGMYIARLTVGQESIVYRMMLVK